MSSPPRPVWSVNLALLFFLALLALGTLSVAYQSGGPPSFVGHTSEEYFFSYITPSPSTNCFSSASTTCTVSCPAGSFALSGYCASSPGTGVASRWTQLGHMGPDRISYTCIDESHVPGRPFGVIVNCMQGDLT